jgi:sugar lactone lactonase YvrE
MGMYIDDDQTIYIADKGNHRILEWKSDAKSGRIVAGGNGQGNRNDQFSDPVGVVLHKETNSLIIADYGNRRVVQWSRQNGASGQIIISDIDCISLTIDRGGYLYVSDGKKHEVKRWRMGDNTGTVVAGGNGQGYCLNQLNDPGYIFVDEDQSVYVSDWVNDRVMKWKKGSSEGTVVAGGQGKGDGLSQLSGPQGVIVDQLDTVYVADFYNNRIMRWYNGATEGTIVVGGNGKGYRLNQFHTPQGISFDRHGNLYVVDQGNHRVQKFNIGSN